MFGKYVYNFKNDHITLNISHAPQKNSNRKPDLAPHTTSYRFLCFTRCFLTISNDYNENHMSIEVKEIVCFHVLLFRLSYKILLNFVICSENMSMILKMTILPLTFHMCPKKTQTRSQTPHPTRSQIGFLVSRDIFLPFQTTIMKITCQWKERKLYAASVFFLDYLRKYF